MDGDYDAQHIRFLWNEHVQDLQRKLATLPDSELQVLSELFVHQNLMFYLQNSIHSTKLGHWHPPAVIGSDEILERKFTALVASMAYVRFLEVQKLYDWIFVAAGGGAYASAYRELRYCLDAIVSAIHLDKESYGAGFLSSLVDAGAGSSPASSRSGFRARLRAIQPEHWQDIYPAFQSLSQHVHPTHNEFAERIISGKLSELMNRDHDPDQMPKLQALTEATTDAILFLMGTHFQEARLNFRKKPKVQAILRERSFPLTRQWLWG